jgi:hypothetical protein
VPSWGGGNGREELVELLTGCPTIVGRRHEGLPDVQHLAGAVDLRPPVDRVFFLGAVYLAGHVPVGLLQRER